VGTGTSKVYKMDISVHRPSWALREGGASISGFDGNLLLAAAVKPSNASN
jgi:hypothetical protein